MKKSIARLIRALQKELDSVETDIDDMVRGTPVFAAKEDLLSSVLDIGPAISRTLMVELPELGTLDRKRIAALAGLAPFTPQSGQWKGKSFIGGGRPAVRCALFMGALVAKGRNPEMKGSSIAWSPPASHAWSLSTRFAPRRHALEGKSSDGHRSLLSEPQLGRPQPTGRPRPAQRGCGPS
jgi:hypothetical protein